MQYRGYHFGTAQYYAAFEDLPQADTVVLRKATLEYLNSFDDKLWFSQPIRSVSRQQQPAAMDFSGLSSSCRFIWG
jgi:hypothetical protein